MWIDFSEYPSLQELKSNAISSSNQCVLAAPLYGVQPVRVTVTLDLLSGDLVLRSGCSSEELANVSAPSGYQPVQWPADCRVVERPWQQWQKIQSDPDWQDLYGSDANPFLTFYFQLADLINEKPIYDKNLAAEEAAWLEAEATAATSPLSSGKFAALAEDEGGGMMRMGGGSCTITNEADPFAILSIGSDTHGWITVTWESCTNYIYGVLSADELSTNTLWAGQAALWGEDGSTNWQDTNTTSVAYQFYRVVRMPPGGDFDGDGMPNDWELQYELNPLDPSDTAGDLDGDDVDNLTEYLQGRDPTRGAEADTGGLVDLNVFTPLE